MLVLLHSLNSLNITVGVSSSSVPPINCTINSQFFNQSSLFISIYFFPLLNIEEVLLYDTVSAEHTI